MLTRKFIEAKFSVKSQWRYQACTSARLIICTRYHGIRMSTKSIWIQPISRYCWQVSWKRGKAEFCQAKIAFCFPQPSSGNYSGLWSRDCCEKTHIDRRVPEFSEYVENTFWSSGSDERKRKLTVKTEVGNRSKLEPRLRDIPFRFKSFPRWILLGLIRLHQLFFSPALPVDTCRFYPTCSHYGYQAIYKYGALKGGWMAFMRILRCNPFNPGGFDPVP